MRSNGSSGSSSSGSSTTRGKLIPPQTFSHPIPFLPHLSLCPSDVSHLILWEMGCASTIPPYTTIRGRETHPSQTGKDDSGGGGGGGGGIVP